MNINIFKIFLTFSIFCLVVAGSLIAYIEYDVMIEVEARLFDSKYPEKNLVLADEMCIFYGFDEVKAIIRDGKKVKLLCG